MKAKTIFILLATLFIASPILAQEVEESCNGFNLDGVYKYEDETPGYEGTRVIIKGNSQKEVFGNGSGYIKAEIKWIGDCKYTMTVKKCTVDGFPAEKGMIMVLKILEIDENHFKYESDYRGSRTVSTLVKVGS